MSVADTSTVTDSSSGASLSLPTSKPACSAAPTAMTSSVGAELRSSTSENMSRIICWRRGILAEPPHRTTWRHTRHISILHVACVKIWTLKVNKLCFNPDGSVQTLLSHTLYLVDVAGGEPRLLQQTSDWLDALVEEWWAEQLESSSEETWYWRHHVGNNYLFTLTWSNSIKPTHRETRITGCMPLPTSAVPVYRFLHIFFKIHIRSLWPLSTEMSTNVNNWSKGEEIPRLLCHIHIKRTTFLSCLFIIAANKTLW